MPINPISLFTQIPSIGTKINEITNAPKNLLSNLDGALGTGLYPLYSKATDVTSLLNTGKLLISNSISVDQALPIYTRDFKTPEETSNFDEERRASNYLMFPLDLRANTEFIKIEFMKYSVTNPSTDNRNTVVEKSIFLPMPSNLQESFSVAYDSTELGAIIGRNMVNIVGDLEKMTGGKGLQDIVNNPQQYNSGVHDIAKKIIRSNLNKNTLAWGAWHLADAALPKGIVSHATGIVPNPYVAQIFQGIGFREFSFSWKFTPHSAKESEELKKILFELKTRMLPGLTLGDIFFTMPDHCRVSFRPDVFKMTKSIITNLSINHAPNGPAFYNDDSTFEYDVSIQLREIELVTRDRVREWETKKGTS